MPRNTVWALLPSVAQPLLFLVALTAQAEVQTQHILDWTMTTRRIEPLWHLRVRTTPEGGGVAQIRTGPIFNIDANERITVIVGYYYTRAKDEGYWSTTHRTFGGVEGEIWNRKVEVDARSLLERHALVDRPDFTRFRNRIRVTRPGRLIPRFSPYIGVEVFVDADGLRSVRYSAGLQRRIGGSLSLDIGYFFEGGRAGTVSERHMIGTTIHWRDRSTRIDTDP